jgi:hypothetical protein
MVVTIFAVFTPPVSNKSTVPKSWLKTTETSKTSKTKGREGNEAPRMILENTSRMDVCRKLTTVELTRMERIMERISTGEAKILSCIGE